MRCSNRPSTGYGPAGCRCRRRSCRWTARASTRVSAVEATPYPRRADTESPTTAGKRHHQTVIGTGASRWQLGTVSEGGSGIYETRRRLRTNQRQLRAAGSHCLRPLPCPPPGSPVQWSAFQALCTIDREVGGSRGSGGVLLTGQPNLHGGRCSVALRKLQGKLQGWSSRVLAG